MQKQAHTEAVTLERLLESRDVRSRYQRALLEAHPEQTLLCLTVQLPGPVKRNALSLVIARAGVEAVRKAFEPSFAEERDLDTGFEAFFLVPMSPEAAKRLACSIEDSHPLGRLMDLDVLEMDLRGGTEGFPVPLGREQIGLQERKCLLCDRPARWCMRERTHSTEALLQEIETIVNKYHP